MHLFLNEQFTTYLSYKYKFPNFLWMQYADGKTNYSTIQEIVDPVYTALVVQDVQKMLVDFIFNKEEFMKH